MHGSTPDWSAQRTRLDALYQLIEKTQQAALASLSSDSADDFVARCGDLSRVLSQELPALAQALAQSKVPHDVQQAFSKVQTGLQALQDTAARLQAGNQRALGVLFPTDQVQTYSQLGAKAYGGVGRSTGTRLKA